MLNATHLQQQENTNPMNHFQLKIVNNKDSIKVSIKSIMILNPKVFFYGKNNIKKNKWNLNL